MSFLKNIFKRKPGGTVLGNLIRGAVKNIPVVGSFLGNGSMMITQEQADIRDLPDADYLAKYGVAKPTDGKPLSQQTGDLIKTQIGQVLPGVALGLQTMTNAGNSMPSPGLNNGLQGGAIDSAKQMKTKDMVMIGGGVLAFLTLLGALIFRGKAKPSYSR